MFKIRPFVVIMVLLSIFATSYIFFSPIQMGNSFDLAGLKKDQFLFASRFDLLINNLGIGDVVMFRNPTKNQINVAAVVDYNNENNKYVLFFNSNEAYEFDVKSLEAKVVYPKPDAKGVAELLSAYVTYRNKSILEEFDAAKKVSEEKIDLLERRIASLTETVTEVLETQSFEIAEPGWHTLRSNMLGISFEYPMAYISKIGFSYVVLEDRDYDPSGQYYSWGLQIKDKVSRDYDRRYSFAGGTSSTFKVGRESGFTEFYEITPELRNRAVKTYKTQYGTEAILVNTPIVWGELGADENDKGATIYASLPIEKDPRFKGIAIYSKDGFTDEQALRIVNSLTID